MKIKKTQKVNIELSNQEIELFISILDHAKINLEGSKTEDMTDKQRTKLKSDKDFIKALEDIVK